MVRSGTASEAALTVEAPPAVRPKVRTSIPASTRAITSAAPGGGSDPGTVRAGSASGNSGEGEEEMLELGLARLPQLP